MPDPTDEVNHRPGGQNVTGAGEGAQTGRDVHRDPTDVVAQQFDLARVHAGSNLDVEHLKRITDCCRQRTARPGPSNMASTPSPVDLMRRPR